MKKVIVTTTINHPTEATIKYSEKEDWQLIVVGDTNTPHDAYKELNCIYLSPEDQEKINQELSNSIGWKSIQRRNIGFLFAYQNNAEIIATVDDDNIPYENWGKNISVGSKIECDIYEPESLVFDPLSVTNTKELWHRGYPIELLSTRHRVEYKGKTIRTPMIQADLWDGDPDIDAMARISLRPVVKYDIDDFYCSNKISPFNSQNTFIHRDVVPFYCVLPHVGRMDDIWASYILQYHFPDSVIYGPASVYQDRNEQDLITNLENEIIGYRNTLNFVKSRGDYMKFLPEKTKNFLVTYRNAFGV